VLFKGCRSPTVAAMIWSSVSGVFALGEPSDLSFAIYTLTEHPTPPAIQLMSVPHLGLAHFARVPLAVEKVVFLTASRESSCALPSG
jgi:hypothetical protein